MVKRRRDAGEGPRRPEAAAADGAPGAGESDAQRQRPGLTPYELERLAIIARNRERLVALGLPALVEQLRALAAPAPKARKPRVKREPAAEEEGPAAGRGPAGDVAGAGAPRRSSRLKEAAARPPPETAEQRFERELGRFVIDGECPRCGGLFGGGHRAHLESCAGAARAARAAGGYSARDRELLAGLTEEERRDERKRALARTKALELSGLVDFSTEAATFVVLGSKGTPYTVKLADDKHTCTCMDYRFRRHACKHILLVQSQLGILDHPSTWHAAVGDQLDELARAAGGGGSQHPEAVPHDKDAEMALKFV